MPEATVAEFAGSTLLHSAVGVVLYGSYARGDFDDESDVDLLVVADRPAGSYRVGAANVSSYTPAQLAQAQGTLFGMHLARDGRVLQDTGGAVVELLDSMGQPDPDVLFARVRHLGAVLHDESPYWFGGRIRVARYLLRTATYVAALADGEPCFSVRELAQRAGEPELVELLAARSDSDAAPPRAIMGDLMQRLVHTVGPLAPNPHGGLRNLIVAEWFEDRARATLGVLVLSSDVEELDYTALSKVIL